jgi:hypothetical protein
VTVLALTTGLGLGLVPATAGDQPAPGANPVTGKFEPAPAAGSSDTPGAARLKDHPAAEVPADDATFLRRLCLDVRGTLPTDMEIRYFVSDDDDDKRAKVVDWMTDDDAAKLVLAKKLGVPPERIHVIRARLSADGQFVELTIEEANKPAVRHLGYTVTGGDQLYNLYRRARIDPDVSPYLNRVQLAAEAPDGQRLATLVEVDTAKDAKTTALKRLYAWQKVALDEKAGKWIQNVPAEQFQYWSTVDGNTYADAVNQWFVTLEAPDSDAEFLKRVLTDVRGSGPTTLELKYFTEDKDPKKREKLIDTLLKDPAVQKKLGDAWKAKMLAPKTATTVLRQTRRADQLFLWVQPDGKTPDGRPLVVPAAPAPPKVAPPTSAAPQPDKFEKLVNELIAAQKSDEAILEALTLATLGRLPTDSEKKLTLASISTASDRKTAWVAVARALAGTGGTVRGAKLKFHADPQTLPVPPAKP